MIAEHAAAVVALLRAVPALTIYDGLVPAKTLPPYTVVYFSTTPADETTLEGVADRVTTTAIVHSVAATSAACRIVADQAWLSLVGATPSVSGRTCSRVRHVDSAPPTRDESTGVGVMDQVDVYEFMSMSA